MRAHGSAGPCRERWLNQSREQRLLSLLSSREDLPPGRLYPDSLKLFRVRGRVRRHFEKEQGDRNRVAAGEDYEVEYLAEKR